MKSNFKNLLGSAIAAQKNEFADIKSKIIVKNEFKNLIPPLTEEEFSQLEANILSEGIRETILLWNNGDDYILVDGHNRFFISQKHGLEFQFRTVSFKDEEEVRDWMIRNQLGRRNLSPEQQSYLRGLRYNREKSQGKRTDLASDQNDTKLGLSTAAKIGKEYNVSEITIKRDSEFADNIDTIGLADPALKQAILRGDSKLSKKEINSIAKEQPSEKGRGVVQKHSRVSSSEIVGIAYQYVQTEKRSMDQIYSAFGKEPGSLKPQEYFLLWKALNQDANR
jgi:ParB-like chromosome segregation protein Spo0J